MLKPTIWLFLAVSVLMGCANEPEKVTFFSLLPPSDRDIRGPANQPPPDYAGEEWVDRDGCLFLKTDGGEWVPRMNIDRTLICDREATASIAANNNIEINTSPDIPPISIDPETGIITEVMPANTVPPSFVQVGLYEDVSEGLLVRERFSSMGFPIVGGDFTPPSGKPMAVVLGPFRDEGFLGDALSTAQSMGYAEAYSYLN